MALPMEVGVRQVSTLAPLLHSTDTRLRWHGILQHLRLKTSLSGNSLPKGRCGLPHQFPPTHLRGRKQALLGCILVGQSLFRSRETPTSGLLRHLPILWCPMTILLSNRKGIACRCSSEKTRFNSTSCPRTITRRKMFCAGGRVHLFSLGDLVEL